VRPSHGEAPTVWLGRMWELHKDLACAKSRRLWRLFGAWVLYALCRREIHVGSRGGRVAHVPVSGHETLCLVASHSW
jgi:hypothetical protein